MRRRGMSTRVRRRPRWGRWMVQMLYRRQHRCQVAQDLVSLQIAQAIGAQDLALQELHARDDRQHGLRMIRTLLNGVHGWSLPLAQPADGGSVRRGAHPPVSGSSGACRSGTARNSGLESSLCFEDTPVGSRAPVYGAYPRA